MIITYAKLRPEVKARLLEALESGRYAQTVGVLHAIKTTDQAEGFCCHGVRCELAVADGILPPPVQSSMRLFYLYGSEGDQMGAMPPRAEMRWAYDLGKSAFTSAAFQQADDTDRHLASMNDNGKTFAEIAQFIRDNM